jgi:hypothetical protein
MIFFSVVIAMGIFVIGYMIGWDRGCRKTHERFIAVSAEEGRRKRQDRYTTKTKKLHLVKDNNRDTRE